MKRYILIAGVNGAGKTTLFQVSRSFFDMPRVNLDEIVRGFGSWKVESDVIRAGMLAVNMINELFQQEISFNQETTLCGKSILRNIEKAKNKGYCIELYYVGLDSPEIAKKRIAYRVRNGGHGIPEADIDRRYNESLENLRKVLSICDVVQIYDNTVTFEKIADYERGKLIWQADSLPKWYMNWKCRTDD